MQRTLSFAAALGAALLLALAPQAAPAHEGHGAEAPTPITGAPAAPRFAAASELFELVGVLEGRQLALYLDHAGDNSPVKDARLELEIGGAAVPATRVADGEFRATLAAPLAEGVVPVTATVEAAAGSDLLAGELDLHAADAHAGEQPVPWRGMPWALGGGAAAAVLALLWALRRTRPLRAGGAV